MNEDALHSKVNTLLEKIRHTNTRLGILDKTVDRRVIDGTLLERIAVALEKMNAGLEYITEHTRVSVQRQEESREYTDDEITKRWWWNYNAIRNVMSGLGVNKRVSATMARNVANKFRDCLHYTAMNRSMYMNTRGAQIIMWLADQAPWMMTEKYLQWVKEHRNSLEELVMNNWHERKHPLLGEEND